MKKTHVILLILTAILAITSAYSLAAISQVYNIKYEWYSEFEKIFEEKKRTTSSDHWTLEKYPTTTHVEIITNPDRLTYLLNRYNFPNAEKVSNSVDFYRYVTLFCTLGKVNSPEYRIKFAGVAQRGSTVEIKVSVNSPQKDLSVDSEREIFIPVDIIRINKNSFPVQDKLYIIFKNQNGLKLGEQYFYVR
jgi:hypothetical protein